MSDERPLSDDAFGTRLGRLLRASEPLSDDFETNLVAAIRADRPIERKSVQHADARKPSWWRAPITIRVSPLAALPIAAVFVAFAVLGVARRRPATPTRAPSVATNIVHDTVSIVRFVFVGEAKSVSLVGDFNAWGAEPVALTPTGQNGAWAVSLPIVSGRHEYAFILDGHRWVVDPFAPASTDEFDTSSSIITVGT